MRVEHFLENSARRLPGKTALVFGDRRISYHELEGSANSLANTLVENGIRRGDRVAVYMDNSVELVTAIFGILKADAAFVLINSTVKADKLAYILNHCQATGVITDADKLTIAVGACNQSPHLRTVCIAGEAKPGTTLNVTPIANTVTIPDYPSPPPPRKGIGLDMAALIYTSGSTGRPKGVIATHLSLSSAAAAIEEYLQNRESDVILNVLPLSFGYGLFQLLVTFKVGGTLVLERSFGYPYRILELMERERVTGFALVPTIAAILLQLNLQKNTLGHLRYITSAAAAMPVHNITRLRAIWPHVKFYSMYGQTECTRISYLDPAQLDIRPASVGRGIPDQELWLVDDAGERVPPGRAGQLVVRGAHVARGYWRDPEATARAFRPGLLPGETVLYTGDLFRMDEEGYLYFISRQDEIIKTRGEKVSPKEVEEVIYTLSGVSETAVIGVPDEVLGQSLRAIVSVSEGFDVSERDVLRHCARHLEDYMVPKSVVFVPRLPRNSNGKIDRRELAATHGTASKKFTPVCNRGDYA
jgi:long-chain acyl-CoA synthetase